MNKKYIMNLSAGSNVRGWLFSEARERNKLFTKTTKSEMLEEAGCGPEGYLHLGRSDTPLSLRRFQVAWSLLGIKWLNKMPAGDRRHGEQELRVKRARRWQRTWIRGHLAGGRPPKDSYTHWLKHKGNSFRTKSLSKLLVPSLPSSCEAYLHKPRPHCPVSCMQRLHSTVANRMMCYWHTLLTSGEEREVGSKVKMTPPQRQG